MCIPLDSEAWNIYQDIIDQNMNVFRQKKSLEDGVQIIFSRECDNAYLQK